MAFVLTSSVFLSAYFVKHGFYFDINFFTINESSVICRFTKSDFE